MENLKGIDIASNKVCETMFGKRSNLSVDDIEMFDNCYNKILENGLDPFLKEWFREDYYTEVRNFVEKLKIIFLNEGGDLPSTNTIKYVSDIDKKIVSSDIINIYNVSDEDEIYQIIVPLPNNYNPNKINYDDETLVYQDECKIKDVISNEDKKYIRFYTHNGDILLNKYLASNRKITKYIVQYYQTKYFETFVKYDVDISCVKEDSPKYIKCYIDSMLNTIEEIITRMNVYNDPLKFIVYRGLSFNNADYEIVRKFYSDHINMAVEMKTFISTSSSIDMARRFSTLKEKGLLIVIYIPQEFTNYINMKCISKYYFEKEILLNIGTKFYIDKIINDTIYCQIIP